MGLCCMPAGCVHSQHANGKHSRGNLFIFETSRQQSMDDILLTAAVTAETAAPAKSELPGPISHTRDSEGAHLRHRMSRVAAS